VRAERHISSRPTWQRCSSSSGELSPKAVSAVAVHRNFDTEPWMKRTVACGPDEG